MNYTYIVIKHLRQKKLVPPYAANAQEIAGKERLNIHVVD
jgi:hypothetical protein